jgi:Holliday junction resolvasome, DNA-binding subunit
MRDRLADWQSQSSPIGTTPTATAQSSHKQLQDAISALVALGYKPQEASRALQSMDAEITTVEDMIRFALKRITP